MKKYSAIYPMIFGIIVSIVGICVKQVGVILLFGVLPILLSVCFMISERKRKKQEKITSAKTTENTKSEPQKTPANNPQLKKPCCVRCGVDLSLLEKHRIKKIGDKAYCDVCEKILNGKTDNGTSPQTEPQKGNAEKEQETQTCVRCKKKVSQSQIVWVGNHRFCSECVKTFGATKKPEVEDHEKQRDAQLQNVANVLEQVERLKKEEASSKVCSICRRQIPDAKWIFVNGEYFCEDCYDFTHNKGKATTEGSAPDLYQISYEIRGALSQSLFLRVTEIADRLIEGGFVFHSVGVGADELSYSRCAAYKVVYTDYYDFKNNMDNALQKLEEENSADHLIFLNNPYVCAFLSRNTLKVCVVSMGEHIVLRWFDTSYRAFDATRVFAEKVVEEVYNNQCTLKQIDNTQVHSAFFENWI